MKSSNPPKNSMQMSSQVNQRASQQNNNASLLNTQNIMGQTILNTVYPGQSQIQNSKQMTSTVKSIPIANSQANNNNSVTSTINQSKASANSNLINQSNQPGSTMQSKLPTLSQKMKEDPNSSSNPKQQSMYNKNINSQMQSVHPSQQQQSMRPSQQQSIHPSQQQSIHPSQQQSIHPSQHQSMYASKQQSVLPSQHQSMYASKQQSILPSQQQSMYASKQHSIHPSQQQSIHPSQQQSIHPSQQQSIHPSQQQSIHPSQQLSMQAQNQSMKNQSINSQQQQGSIRPGSQMGKQQNGSKNPSVKISRKSSIRTSRNKSPPLVTRGKDGQIKASGSDFNGNNFYINCDEEKNTPDIATHLSEYVKNEISIHSSRIDIPKNNKPGNGFRFYGQLTHAGRNQNGKTKIDQDTSQCNRAMHALLVNELPTLSHQPYYGTMSNAKVRRICETAKL